MDSELFSEEVGLQLSWRYLPSKALAASTKFDQSKSEAESGRGMSPGSGMGCLLCSWMSVRELSEAENSPAATKDTSKHNENKEF